MQYKLTRGTAVVRINDDGTSDSFGPLNREYSAFQAWRMAGNTPMPYIAPEPATIPVVTAEQARAALNGAGFTSAQVDALFVAAAVI